MLQLRVYEGDTCLRWAQDLASRAPFTELSFNTASGRLCVVMTTQSTNVINIFKYLLENLNLERCCRLSNQETQALNLRIQEYRDTQEQSFQKQLKIALEYLSVRNALQPLATKFQRPDFFLPLYNRSTSGDGTLHTENIKLMNALAPLFQSAAQVCRYAQIFYKISHHDCHEMLFSCTTIRASVQKHFTLKPATVLDTEAIFTTIYHLFSSLQLNKPLIFKTLASKLIYTVALGPEVLSLVNDILNQDKKASAYILKILTYKDPRFSMVYRSKLLKNVLKIPPELRPTFVDRVFSLLWLPGINPTIIEHLEENLVTASDSTFLKARMLLHKFLPYNLSDINTNIVLSTLLLGYTTILEDVQALFTDQLRVKKEDAIAHLSTRTSALRNFYRRNPKILAKISALTLSSDNRLFLLRSLEQFPEDDWETVLLILENFANREEIYPIGVMYRIIYTLSFLSIDKKYLELVRYIKQCCPVNLATRLSIFEAAIEITDEKRLSVIHIYQRLLTSRVSLKVQQINIAAIFHSLAKNYSESDYEKLVQLIDQQASSYVNICLSLLPFSAFNYDPSVDAPSIVKYFQTHPSDLQRALDFVAYRINFLNQNTLNYINSILPDFYQILNYQHPFMFSLFQIKGAIEAPSKSNPMTIYIGLRRSRNYRFDIVAKKHTPFPGLQVSLNLPRLRQTYTLALEKRTTVGELKSWMKTAPKATSATMQSLIATIQARISAVLLDMKFEELQKFEMALQQSTDSTFPPIARELNAYLNQTTLHDLAGLLVNPTRSSTLNLIQILKDRHSQAKNARTFLANFEAGFNSDMNAYLSLKDEDSTKAPPGAIYLITLLKNLHLWDEKFSDSSKLFTSRQQRVLNILEAMFACKTGSLDNLNRLYSQILENRNAITIGAKIGSQLAKKGTNFIRNAYHSWLNTQFSTISTFIRHLYPLGSSINTAQISHLSRFLNNALSPHLGNYLTPHVTFDISIALVPEHIARLPTYTILINFDRNCDLKALIQLIIRKTKAAPYEVYSDLNEVMGGTASISGDELAKMWYFDDADDTFELTEYGAVRFLDRLGILKYHAPPADSDPDAHQDNKRLR